ncbi:MULTISPECIES: hypothetical protein [Leptolyngbya]|jgi:hypothetical protein|uniref:hypothetical protein n=1 Tax=Leptolyngbya TaxID=47251 RepID=UPI0003825B26|nr:MULTISPECIES: hypothetical protein [Leptolyngbya]MBD2371103.1 hypothetical protein [Leptolyngbya sp. FACHB-161]MBD2377571.1 hypothetical protein [Leptolyngbya sp. FACHB-238]MBD2402024.1 hypothetical protein [Leptolyngbya sp. FACHB-239]MBD2408543.1 hypothetical protein [Leptolyngbya sp. FACHB-402]BAS60443.1 hypothetical protein LBWT_Y0310 [Leptolyngbya boryana IAM M-101]
MPRGKKSEVNPVTEMPVIEVTPVMGEPDKVNVERKESNNVIPFTGTDQSVQNKPDTTAIDQFLAQYGIELV